MLTKENSLEKEENHKLSKKVLELEKENILFNQQIINIKQHNESYKKEITHLLNQIDQNNYKNVNNISNKENKGNYCDKDNELLKKKINALEIAVETKNKEIERLKVIGNSLKENLNQKEYLLSRSCYFNNGKNGEEESVKKNKEKEIEKLKEKVNAVELELNQSKSTICYLENELKNCQKMNDHFKNEINYYRNTFDRNLKNAKIEKTEEVSNSNNNNIEDLKREIVDWVEKYNEMQIYKERAKIFEKELENSKKKIEILINHNMQLQKSLESKIDE